MSMSKIFKALFGIFIVVALYGTARDSLVRIIHDGENFSQWVTTQEEVGTDEIEIMEADILPAGVAENDGPDGAAEVVAEVEVLEVVKAKEGSVTIE